jgi:hypothetical protein
MLFPFALCRKRRATPGSETLRVISYYLIYEAQQIL